MAASILSRLAVAIALVGVATPAGPALADKKPKKGDKSDKDKKKLAKQYVDAGLAAEEAGDYDQAVALYEKAYEVVPHPILWFNIGQAHRLAGRDEEALAAYQRYLADDPKGPKAKDAKGFIKEIEPRVVKARAEAEEKARIAAEAEAARKAAEEAKADAEAARKRAEEAERRKAEEKKEAPEEPGERSSGGGRKTLGLIVGGTGLAVTATGAVFGFLAKGKWSDAEAICGADMICDSDTQLAESQALAGDAAKLGNLSTALVIGGAVAIGVGAVLWLTAPSGGASERSAWIVPTVSPEGVGVAFGGAL